MRTDFTAKWMEIKLSALYPSDGVVIEKTVMEELRRSWTCSVSLLYFPVFHEQIAHLGCFQYVLPTIYQAHTERKHTSAYRRTLRGGMTCSHHRTALRLSALVRSMSRQDVREVNQGNPRLV